MRRRLQADVVEPAQAKRSQSVARAKADAASIIEDGRARAAALDQVIQSWQGVGPGARDVFLLQKLDHLTAMTTSTIKDLQVDKITVLPASNGDTNLATTLVSAAEQIKAGLGIDVVEAVKGKLTP